LDPGKIVNLRNYTSVISCTFVWLEWWFQKSEILTLAAVKQSNKIAELTASDWKANEGFVGFLCVCRVFPALDMISVFSSDQLGRETRGITWPVFLDMVSMLWEVGRALWSGRAHPWMFCSFSKSWTAWNHRIFEISSAWFMNSWPHKALDWGEQISKGKDRQEMGIRCRYNTNRLYNRPKCESPKIDKSIWHTSRA
jgi:hypothetical protein